MLFTWGGSTLNLGIATRYRTGSAQVPRSERMPRHVLERLAKILPVESSLPILYAYFVHAECCLSIAKYSGYRMPIAPTPQTTRRCIKLKKKKEA
jgi:hypothetical protein